MSAFLELMLVTFPVAASTLAKVDGYLDGVQAPLRTLAQMLETGSYSVVYTCVQGEIDDTLKVFVDVNRSQGCVIFSKEAISVSYRVFISRKADPVVLTPDGWERLPLGYSAFGARIRPLGNRLDGVIASERCGGIHLQRDIDSPPPVAQLDYTARGQRPADTAERQRPLAFQAPPPASTVRKPQGGVQTRAAKAPPSSVEAYFDGLIAEDASGWIMDRYNRRSMHNKQSYGDSALNWQNKVHCYRDRRHRDPVTVIPG